MAAMRFALVGFTGVATAASPVLLGSTHSNVIVDFWAPDKEPLERCSSRSATCFPVRSQNCVALAVASYLASSKPPKEEPYSAVTEYVVGVFWKTPTSALPHAL